ARNVAFTLERVNSDDDRWEERIRVRRRISGCDHHAGVLCSDDVRIFRTGMGASLSVPRRVHLDLAQRGRRHVGCVVAIRGKAGQQSTLEVTPHPCAQPASHTSDATPQASVRSVTGTPARSTSPNRIATPRAAARSATISVAIEPSSVRFPAKVELIAITSQMNRALGTCGITGRHKMTAGTLDTRFESAVMAPLVTRASCHGAPCSADARAS